MNYFINIQINPDSEFRENVLLNKTFTKLHKALHDLNQNNIGVSFPNCKVKLGDSIRLHGSQQDLQNLHTSNWLGGLSGYCLVSDILPVPSIIEGYKTVSRKQPTMTLKKLEKRVIYQKEQGVLTTEDEVQSYERQYKKAMFDSSLDNPYLELQSTSSGKLYRVFIEFGRLQESPTSGSFNYFGLSKTATIPWF